MNECIMQGAGWPSLAKICVERVPPQAQGRVWALLSAAGNAGTSVRASVKQSKPTTHNAHNHINPPTTAPLHHTNPCLQATCARGRSCCRWGAGGGA